MYIRADSMYLSTGLPFRAFLGEGLASGLRLRKVWKLKRESKSANMSWWRACDGYNMTYRTERKGKASGLQNSGHDSTPSKIWQNLIGLTDRLNALSQLIDLEAGKGKKEWERERENVNKYRKHEDSLHDWTFAKLHLLNLLQPSRIISVLQNFTHYNFHGRKINFKHMNGIVISRVF